MEENDLADDTLLNETLMEEKINRELDHIKYRIQNERVIENGYNFRKEDDSNSGEGSGSSKRDESLLNGSQLQNSSFTDKTFPNRSISEAVINESRKRRQLNLSRNCFTKSSADELGRIQISIGKNHPNKRRIGKLISPRAVCCSRQYVVEHFGPQTPIAVTESLIYNPGAKTNATVNVNPESGWGWYVCGRKLLVWPVVPNHQKIPPTVLSRELTLPSSDLAHSANLVVVYVEPGNQAASCIAVSPEGTVRYWQTIGQYNSWCDVNTHLGGEEVCAVRYMPPLGCLAVTTSGSMILLTTSVLKGMPTVTTRHVSVPHGWFNSIGRRMSSIIFGMVPPCQGLESKVVKVLTKHRRTNSWHVFLMSGLALQSWNIDQDGNHTLYFESDLTYMLKEAFKATLKDEVELAFLDMKYSETGLMFLAACSRPRSYMIVEFLMENEKAAPTQYVKHCELSKQDILVLEGMTDKINPNLQFLPLTSSALVFNNKVILGVPFGAVSDDSLESLSDRLDIPGGFVLGGQMYLDTPIFFSVNYGFVSVTPIDTSSIDVMNSSASGNISLTHSSFFESEAQVSSTKMDYISALKTAFIHYVRKNMVQCKAVINKEFPNTSSVSVDSPLAITLVKVSSDIINDMPGKDPRWKETKNFPNLPGVQSLHLENQLAEKQHAHDLFLQFVKELSLSEQLGRVNRKGCPTPVKTIHVLHEHNEKITAAIALRKIHNKYQPLIDKMMKLTCEENNLMPNNDLTYQDYFFRHISKIDDGFRNLCEQCAKIPSFDVTELKNFADVVLDSNTILVEVLQAVISKQFPKSSQCLDSNCLPWLAAPGIRGLYDYLMRQVNTSYSLVTDHVYAVSKPRVFLKQMFLLCDVILYSQKEVALSQKFIDLRTVLIRPFVMLKEFEMAAQLGEKYKDFEILIEICYNQKLTEKLMQYMDRYEDEGFCEDVFSWYMKEGRRSELIKLKIPSEFDERLSLFLEKYPSIAWLHMVRLQDVHKSHLMLTEYAMRSNAKYAIKTERAVALAKMAALADKKTSDILPKIITKLQILRIERKLKESLLDKYGFCRRTIRPLSATELIQLFICEENSDASEKDFKSALELLHYVEPELMNSQKTEIWVKAINRDSWINLDVTLPLETLCKMMVYKLMELVILTENDADQLIPSIEELLAHDDLQGLRTNTVFTYMLQYVYEYFLEPGGFDKTKPREIPENERITFRDLLCYK